MIVFATNDSYDLNWSDSYRYNFSKNHFVDDFNHILKIYHDVVKLIMTWYDDLKYDLFKNSVIYLSIRLQRHDSSLTRSFVLHRYRKYDFLSRHFFSLILDFALIQIIDSRIILISILKKKIFMSGSNILIISDHRNSWVLHNYLRLSR